MIAYANAHQKNKKEDRIPINKNSRAILKRCATRAKGRATVFRPMTKDFVTHKFKKYIRKAKLPDHIRFHDLRHTYGSYLAMKGHGEKTVQELMRHASIESIKILFACFPALKYHSLWFSPNTPAAFILNHKSVS